MDDEFKLCWKNFQDNIASGFQNLYDRGDLVDVTLACDGKLLQAHKIVLAICSPYFQEIFITNPCKHPIIILKDVTFNIMRELLEFMYQGVVNVKHTELQSFMKIGQLLQIKGLATNSSSSSAPSTSSEKLSSQINNNNNNNTNNNNTDELNSSACNNDSARNVKSNSSANEGNDVNNGDNSNSGKTTAAAVTTANTTTSSVTTRSSHSPATATSSPSPMGFSISSISSQNFKNSTPVVDSNLPLHAYHASMKRLPQFSGGDELIYSRNKLRRTIADQSSEHDSMENAAMDQVNAEDFFLPAIPHITMSESRYELNAVKRESDHHGGGGGGVGGGSSSAGSSSSAAISAAAAAASLRNSFGPFNFDYNLYKNNSSNSAVSGQEYPNELHLPNDYSKNFGNHMDIPPISPGEHWFQGKLEFMLSQRGKPLLVHDGHTFGIQYVRKDKKYWQCNLSRKFNCKARVTTTDTGEIIVTNNEHCHTEIRQHLRKDYQRHKVMMNALMNLSTNRLAENIRRHQNLGSISFGNPHHIATGAPTLPLHHNDAGIEQQKVLNLGKSAMDDDDDGSTPFSPGEMNQDELNDTPLDCGIRSVVAAAAAAAAATTARSLEHSQKSNNYVTSAGGGDNNNESLNDGKWNNCKKETLDSF